MALIQPSFQGNYLCVDAPGMPTLKVPCVGSEQRHSPLREVGVWDDKCPAVDEGDEAAEWFKKFLGNPKLRLVRIPNDHNRKVESTYQVPETKNIVSFADGFPFLLTSVGSLNSLNSHIQANEKSVDKQILPMTRFRPNIVVDGPDVPFIEDTWKKVKLGDVVLNFVKLCTRCKITTNDQEKGEFQKEPLATLETFRKGLLQGGSEVCFGQNLIHENSGEIKVGQTVQVLESISAISQQS